jgi:hypothetical protein
MIATPFVSNLMADLVWPALVLEQRLLAVLPIASGLVAEWLVLWLCGFGLTWKKAAVVDVLMNAASSLIGIFLIPLLGVAWEFFPGLLIQKIFHVGTFNLITWVATPILATFATTAVEATVVRWGFKIALGQRRFWTLFGANAISVGIAFASLFLHPPRY